MKKEEEEIILFKRGVKIQGLNRIALPKELLENLSLNEGDKIKIYMDSKGSKIIIKGDNDE